MGHYANELYAQNVSLQCENKALRDEIASFKSGERYIALQKGYGKIIAGYKKALKKKTKEVAEAHAEKKRVRGIWLQECDKDWEQYQKEMDKKDQEIERLRNQVWETAKKYDDKMAALIEGYEQRLKEEMEASEAKDTVISELKEELAHALAIIARNGENAGIPTGQTGIGQKKRRPNGRKHTGKKKGGQHGHKKHDLEAPSEEEINAEAEHKLDGTEMCPGCGSSELKYTGEWEDKYEFDIEVKVIKRRHRYFLYECLSCGTIVLSSEGPDFRFSKCQYGPGVQAMMLSLMNTVNAPMNKAAMFLAGVSGQELTPCEGFAAKIQRRAAMGLRQFYEDMRLEIITLGILYWDDTVIFINTTRACIRFYGDENHAFFTAHEKKDLPGVLEDNVLPRLTGDTYVMHDHNMINYNAQFHFRNLECNQHLERDCQKNSDDTKHQWSIDMKNLISTTIEDRKDKEGANMKRFSDTYVDGFNRRLDGILQHGWLEYEADAGRMKKYGAPAEKALLIRIEKYRENYFAWLEDFSLPTTNNLSERGLHPIKSKMKISGQYESVDYANHFAALRTYIETGRRNGINEIEALRRLCAGNPYTVKEIFS